MNEEHERDKYFMELIREYIEYKFGVLLYISGIMAALLIIGSFSGNLFPLNNLVRFIILVLLVLIVLSLQIYLDEINRGLERFMDEFYKDKPIDNPHPSITIWGSIKFLLFSEENGKKSDKKFGERLASQWPMYIVCILWIITIILIFLIWANADTEKRYRDFNYKPGYHNKIWKN